MFNERFDEPITGEVDIVKPTKRAWKKSIAFKFATPIAVVFLIAFISVAHTSLTGKISQQLKSAMLLGVDVDEELGKSQFISNLLPGAVEVSSDAGSGALEVIQDFNATNHDGAVFGAGENDEIRAYADGIITENTGRRLEIINFDGTTVIYDGCKEAPLGVGIRVKKGDLVAVAASDGLKIRVFRSSVQIDPVAYIKGTGDGK